MKIEKKEPKPQNRREAPNLRNWPHFHKSFQEGPEALNLYARSARTLDARQRVFKTINYLPKNNNSLLIQEQPLRGCSSTKRIAISEAAYGCFCLLSFSYLTLIRILRARKLGLGNYELGFSNLNF